MLVANTTIEPITEETIVSAKTLPFPIQKKTFVLDEIEHKALSFVMNKSTNNVVLTPFSFVSKSTDICSR